MRYLVTGATGFIGSHLVDALLATGHQVDGVDINPNPPRQAKGYTFLHGDVRYWCRGTEKWDAIFHLAARARIQPSFVEPLGVVDHNVYGTLRMLDLACQSQSRFIYAGSSTCDGDIYANPYALSKHLGEDLCHLYAKVYGVPCAIARFYNVYGPRQIEEGPYATAMGIWEKSHREGRPLPMCGDGSKRRDWTHVEDIVSGLLAVDLFLRREAITARAAEFHLGTGRNVSVAEVLAMFGGAIEKLPDRPGEAMETLAVNVVGRKTLNWEPKWRIEDYIHDVCKQA